MLIETASVILTAAAGGSKSVGYGHPCYCKLDECRVRINRIIDSTSVEVMDNNGRILPDYRHPSNLVAY